MKYELIHCAILVSSEWNFCYVVCENLHNLNEGASSPLAPADFEIKVKRIAHSIVHFDQRNKLISKM